MLNRQRPVSSFQNGNLAATALFVIVASLVAAFIGIVFGQKIIDTAMAAGFSPSSQIASINTSLKLTGEAKTIFYASQPRVENQDQFNVNCKSTERTMAMLGCYYRRKIYLYNVTNSELKGAVEVTAAHELLHAAYERLPFYERSTINNLVDKQYQKVKNDRTIKDLVAYYEKAEPGEITNELHSIIGTTVASLDPELERYYARYFDNRQTIVTMNKAYSAVFEKVQTEADELSRQINIEGPSIEADLASYEADRRQLESDITVFNERAASGGFTSQSSFQVTRVALVNRSLSLNDRRDGINARVDEYNKLIARLNELSVRSNELNKSINGISAPETTL